MARRKPRRLVLPARRIIQPGDLARMIPTAADFERMAIRPEDIVRAAELPIEPPAGDAPPRRRRRGSRPATR